MVEQKRLKEKQGGMIKAGGRIMRNEREKSETT